MMDGKLIAAELGVLRNAVTSALVVTNAPALAVREISASFDRLAVLFDPESKSPFDVSCPKCVDSLFVGNLPCPNHQPPPAKR